MSHKCFISYHKNDKDDVANFCQKFSGSFIHRGIKVEDDIINSNNTDYVMRWIRELYLQNSTVTIVLIGKCTWARRFVDWEIQASLKKPTNGYPNGLVAIKIRNSYNTLPNRLLLNVASGYSNIYSYPSSSTDLTNIINESYNARINKSFLINNPRDKFSYNRQC